MRITSVMNDGLTERLIQSMHKVRRSIMNVTELRSTNTSVKTEECRRQAELFRKKVENEWFSQSLMRLQFGTRKEHKLFQEKEVKNGVFGTKTLAEAAGFHSDYDVDWQTEETGELTEEQIRRREYNEKIEEMRWQLQQDLGGTEGILVNKES